MFPKELNACLQNKQKRKAYMSALRDFEPYLEPGVFKRCIRNGFPEAGGGGSAATESDCTEATGTDAAPEASSDDDDGGDSDGDPDGHRPQQPSPLRALPCNAVKPTGANLPPENSEFELWRLPTVIKHYPVSRRTWLDGVKAGLYPQPLKIAKRAIAWRASDIRALVASL